MPRRQCANCRASLGFLAKKAVKCSPPVGCAREFCRQCANYALSSDEKPNKLQVCCKECFKTHSTIDFTSQLQVVGASKGEGVSVLFVHGGGGSRKMFWAHAKRLAETKGYRCVLMDLPGHGALMDSPLSLGTSLEAIHRVASEELADFNGQKPIYVGGSLGGYIGMEFLGKYPQMFSAAIITMCGQNVGVGRGCAASAGLVAMNFAVKHASAIQLLSGLQNAVKKNGHIADELLQEISLRSGMFFNQGDKQIEILRHSDPLQTLPAFTGRVLFINGSKDHRDSEHKWVKACRQAKLLLYDGADHFFSHDDRFMDRFIQDMAEFIEERPAGTAQEAQPAVDQQQVIVEQKQ